MNNIATLPAGVLNKLIDRNPAVAKSAAAEMYQAIPRHQPPCEWEGEEGGPKGYHLCDHDDEPLGMWVCKCSGCGPRCPGYKAVDLFGPVTDRHLIYHVLPVDNGVWRNGVAKLKNSWGLFTGRKIFAIMTGGPVREQADPSEGVKTLPRSVPLESPGAVREFLPPDAEVIEIPNDPARWELSSWPVLWDMVLKTAKPTDAVLYAHAKGVTRRAGSPCHRWADLLYDLALNHWDTVEAVLRKYPVAGSMAKFGRHFGPPMAHSKWHYHGNFWWARAGSIKQRLASVPMPQDRWATEAWVGTAYTPQECGEVFKSRDRTFFLYNPVHLNRVLTEYRLWLNDHPSKSYPPKVSLPVSNVLH